MNRVITVRDVLETHDCVGRKYIEVTSMAEDEIVPSRYALTRGIMLPHEKLMLATVSPMDEVEVIYTPYQSFGTVVGEYVSNRFDAMIKDPLCRCGTPLTSDGVDVYCINPECPLTISARLSRLAETQFFTKASIPGIDGEFSFILGDNPYYSQPFLPILNPRLWGSNDKTVEHILLQKPVTHVSVATFLVQDLFREFLDCVGTRVETGSVEYQGFDHFYGMMDHLIHRRNYESNIQNKLMLEFIWSLGIQSLRREVISSMIVYEASLGQEDILPPYAWLLARPGAMSRELGVHPLEAETITREFYSRKHEFADIFMYYSATDSMHEVLSNIDRSLV